MDSPSSDTAAAELFQLSESYSRGQRSLSSDVLSVVFQVMHAYDLGARLDMLIHLSLRCFCPLDWTPLCSSRTLLNTHFFIQVDAVARSCSSVTVLILRGQETTG